MNDFLRESFSYSKIFKEIRKIERKINPERIAYGSETNQYFLYYEPCQLLSDKIIIWVHGGGWGGPYCFNEKSSFVLRTLENRLFPKGYDRKQAEPLNLLTKNHIPMLLIQSRQENKSLDKFYTWIEER